MKKLQKPGQTNYSKKDVVIVVPLHKTDLNEDETLSIKQLKKTLKGYPLFLAIPKKLENKKFPDFEGFQKITFEDKYFESYKGYNDLLKIPLFYEKFQKYKYILIYQTDCLVYKDNLLEFCNKNYDYIGAPEFLYNTKGKLVRMFVGNGGLSLRKIKPAIKITREWTRYPKKLKWLFMQILWLPKNVYDYATSTPPRAISHILTVNEDMFWSFEAKRVDKNFKVAPVKEASKFAIEREKDICLKMNNGELPFGVHAFEKYNKDFWLKKLK